MLLLGISEGRNPSEVVLVAVVIHQRRVSPVIPVGLNQLLAMRVDPEVQKVAQLTVPLLTAARVPVTPLAPRMAQLVRQTER